MQWLDWIGVAAAGVVLLLVLGIVYQWLGAVGSGRAFPAPGTLVAVDGRRLHCRCGGAGTPAVVFEAGIAASSVSWSLTQPAVEAFTRACSYDRAGLAWSDPGVSRRSMRTFVSELRKLLNGAGIAPPYVLVGHSFGGLIVRGFARAFPFDVAGLVFVDTLHPEEWLNPSREQLRMLRGGVFLSGVGAVLARVGVVRLCLVLLTRGAAGPPRRFSRLFGRQAAQLLERIVGEVQKLPADVLPAVQAYWSHPRAFRGMAHHLSCLPLCAQEIGRPEETFRDLPLVVISAANRDPRWLAADAALAGSSRAGRHVRASRGGHWVQLDDPSVVIDAVHEVVRRARENQRV